MECICTQFHEQCVHIWQKMFSGVFFPSSGTKYTPFMTLQGNQSREVARRSLKMLHLQEGRRILESPVLLSIDENKEIQ